jgi:hypothetical protein
MRFTIRSIMIAVVVAAVLLAPLGGKGPLVVAILHAISNEGWPSWAVLFLLCLDLIGAHWLVVRGWRRAAAGGFWILAVLANTLYVACCIAPSVHVLLTLKGFDRGLM